MPVLTVPKELRTPLGEQGSDALVIFINEALNEQKDNIVELNAERFESKLIVGLSNLRTEFKADIAELRSEFKSDIANLRTEFKADIANLQSEFKSDIANLRTEFKSDIADTKISLIKWMIGIAIAFSAFNITVLSVILSILIK